MKGNIIAILYLSTNYNRKNALKTCFDSIKQSPNGILKPLDEHRKELLEWL